MNNTFSRLQISKTGNLDSSLISRQNKLNLMADLMRMKYENPNLKQSEIANQLGYSSSTLQRNRNDIDMILPHTIQPKNTKKRTKKASNTNFDNNSQGEHDLNRPRLTSNDLKETSNEPVKNKRNKINKIGEINGDPGSVQISGEDLIEQAFSSD